MLLKKNVYISVVKNQGRLDLIQSFIYSQFFCRYFLRPLKKTLFAFFQAEESFTEVCANVSNQGMFTDEYAFVTDMLAADMKELYFPLNSQVYSLNTFNETIEVLEHYNIGAQSQIVQLVGNFKNKSLTFTERNIYERRSNLNGFRIRAETLIEYPYVLDVDNGRITGAIGDLWHDTIEEQLNLTTSVSSPPDENWGSLLEDGSWDGMVGGLLQGRADVIVAPLYRTVARERVIQYSETFDIAATGLFVKFPKRDASWTTFLDPFTPVVWSALFLLFVTLSFALSITYKFGQEHSINQDSFTFWNAPLVVWSSFVAQGSPVEPKTTSTKIVFLIAFLLGLINLSSFNATLTSYLAVFKVSLPFDNLEGIFASDFTIGGIRGAIIDSFFTAPNGSVKKRIANEILSKNPDTELRNYEGAHEKILNEDFAFVYSVENMD